ncbi:hypothetical protein J658_0509 [Acinetobacter baumannii 573719]|nr:hypothetical protein J658_0509 [Acinetobacter baumannii 573719]
MKLLGDPNSLFDADRFWNDALLSKDVCELLLLSNHFAVKRSG